MAKHPRREIPGRSFEGTPCLELMNRDGKRPVARNSRGYAVVYDGQGGMVLAHRAALAIATGRDVWTEPLQVDHRCHCRRCCRPEHLEWVTPKENSSTERTSPEGLEVKRANGHAAVESGRCAAQAAAARVPIISKRLDTGEFHYHQDQTAAARELGLHVGSISNVVHGKARRAGRYFFERFRSDDPVHAALRDTTLTPTNEVR